MENLNGSYRLIGLTVMEMISAVDGISLMEASLSKHGETIKLPFIGRYADYCDMIDNDVDIITSKDIIKGKLQPVIKTITVLEKALVFDRTENIKLYSDDNQETESNILFSELPIDDVTSNCLVYCQSIKFTSSDKAKWAELTCLDRRRNVAKIRLFDPTTRSHELQDKYVRMDIKRSKQYGLSAVSDIIEEEGVTPLNTDVEIARRFILKCTAQDEELSLFMKKFDFINKIAEYNFEVLGEKGCLAVQLASELALAQEFTNITPSVDVKLLLRGLVLRKGYCVIRNEQKSIQSKSTQNFLMLLQGGTLIQDKKAVNMVEENPSYETLERKLVLQIEDMAALVITETKTEAGFINRDPRWR